MNAVSLSTVSFDPKVNRALSFYRLIKSKSVRADQATGFPNTRFLLCLLSRRMNIKAIAGLTSATERPFCLPGRIMGARAESNMLWRGYSMTGFVIYEI